MESVWAYREETLYPRFFGTVSRGIFPLRAQTFARLDATNIDPRWLFLGDFEFRPHADRDSWLYVTSGGSTPWETQPEAFDESAYSWLGVEYVLETPTAVDWAVIALQRLLAYHVLATHGRFGEVSIPDYGHRIPAGGPVDGNHSQLTFLAVSRPSHYPATAQLDSGKFDFLHVVGITEAERDFAKRSSTEQLLNQLTASGAAPVTDAARRSVAVGQ